MDNQVCGYDATFVSDTPEYLRCVICHLVLRDPVLIISCGHKYCTPCFNQIKTLAGESDVFCPVDRNMVDMTRVCEEAGLRRLIQSLVVKCKGHENGCSWEGELSDLNVHEEQCPLTKTQPQQQQPDNSALMTTLNEFRCRLDRCEKALSCYEECLESKQKEVAHVKMLWKDGIETLKQNELRTQERLTELERENAEMKMEMSHLKKNLDDSKKINQFSEEEISWLKALIVKNNSTVASANNAHCVLSPDTVQPKVLSKPTVKKSLELYHGSADNLTIDGDNILDIGNELTVFTLPAAILSRGDKVYFEVQCKDIWKGGCSGIGWAYDIKEDERFSLGSHYRFRGVKWFLPHDRLVMENGQNVSPNNASLPNRSCSKCFGVERSDLGSEYVIGVAADMTTGRLLYSFNGNWGKPLGVAFENLVKGTQYYPVFGGKHITLILNFGETEFKHAPPDKSYKKFNTLFSE